MSSIKKIEITVNDKVKKVKIKKTLKKEDHKTAKLTKPNTFIPRAK